MSYYQLDNAVWNFCVSYKLSQLTNNDGLTNSEICPLTECFMFLQNCSHNPLASDCLCCVGFCLPWTCTAVLFEVRVSTKLDPKCSCILPSVFFLSFFLSSFVTPFTSFGLWYSVFSYSTCCGRQFLCMRAVMCIFVWAGLCFACL